MDRLPREHLHAQCGGQGNVAKHAQAIGDLETLRAHDLPAERVTLEGDDPAAALRALTERLRGLV